MAYAGLLATVDLYQLEKDQLTSQESDILMRINDATRQTTKVSEAQVNAVQDLKKEYGQDSSSSTTTSSADSTEYQVALEELQDKFNAELAKVNEWEKELEVQKTQIDNEIQELSASLDSYKSILKTNVKADSSYGEVTSGSSGS